MTHLSDLETVLINRNAMCEWMRFIAATETYFWLGMIVNGMHGTSTIYRRNQTRASERRGHLMESIQLNELMTMRWENRMKC